MSDSVLTGYKMRLEFEDIHRRAGFPHVFSESEIRQALLALAQWLDQNKLTTRPLTPVDGVIHDDFKLFISDLNAEGFELGRKGYIDNWTAKSKVPTDVSILERGLKKLRTIKSRAD